MAAPRAPQNLLPAAALVSLLVLLLGATGLFSLGYTSRQTSLALQKVSALHDAQLAAVESQVSFKTQVQEWKNLLLRGREPADRQIYLSHFEAREAEVQAGLAGVKKQFALLGQDETKVASALTDHLALGRAYRLALAAHPFGDASASFAIDTAVRGIDRKLNDDIDTLARAVERSARDELTHFQTAATERYAVMRKVTLGCGALTVLAAFWLVFSASRSRRTQATA